MISEIKTIVQNYINNTALCCLMEGIVTSDGDVQVNEKLIIPNELLVGNSKGSITSGSRVRLLRDHGGKKFFILEVVS